MPYRSEYTRAAPEHLRSLTARQRATVIDEMNQQLRYEPTMEEDPEQKVIIAAIGIKRRNRLYIGREPYDL